jgi:hypothetical protein
MEKYRIQTMIGDCQVPGQPYWDKTFEHLTDAVAAALEQQTLFASNNPRHYTFVTDDIDAMHVVWATFDGRIFQGVEAEVLCDGFLGPDMDKPLE